MLRNQQITLSTKLKSLTEIGLRIDTIINEPSKNAVPIYNFIYMLDTLRFKEWTEVHKYLLEGPIIFWQRGIKVLIPGQDKWDKTGFSIEDKNGQEFFLPLLEHEIQFRVHRDLAHRKEWCIYIEETAIAAHTD